MSKNMESSEELMPCPGKRLQMARETKGMDVAKVAEQLHLSRAMVNALEAEDYGKLPARVFVRGYYKNYARLVELPEEVILQEFDDRCPDGDGRTPPPVAARGARREVSSNHSLVRLITWLVVLTLVAMLVIWWQGYFKWPDAPKVIEKPATEFQQESAAVAEDNSTAAEEMVEDVIPAIAEPGLQAEAADQLPLAAVEATDAVVAPAAGEETEAVVAPDAVEAADTVGTPAAGEETEAIVAPALVEATGAVVIPAAVEPKPVEAREIAEISVPLKPELIVVFSGDCWVDIRDSTRQFKIFGKMTDGDMRKLGGEPPYTMVFGDYNAAKLLVNGKPYDLSAHARGNTAKFTFDPSPEVNP